MALRRVYYIFLGYQLDLTFAEYSSMLMLQ